MFSKVVNYFKRNPGLFFLILILIVIDLVSLKPQFYLLGWDNYSSYFNQPNNFFRTLFSAWREYRGLGVPSDSEVTDIFRQLFYIILNPLVGQKLLDQLYIVLALNAGVILMYFFATSIFKSLFKEEKYIKFIDIFGFFSAFFYLFNLNTLSTFYFPMIMFVTRFFSLPLLFFIFFRLLNQTKISKKEYLFFILGIFFTAGSFMVATIFITLFIAVFIFTATQIKLKKLLLILIFFLGINSFWLLPFANYTVQKSSIIRLAPTFIDANEALLNKPKSFFDFSKQTVFYPNFFEMNYTKTSGESKPFHPLADNYDKFPYNIIFYIFPLLYLVGSFLILFKSQLRRKFLWIPLQTLLFLFLSLKEFSALGFLYLLLNKITPFFGVVFRFGDTKFHALITFSGSLAAAFILIYLIQFLSKKLIKLTIIFILFFILSTLFVFRTYFNGNLIGFFMYNQIPQAYIDIAHYINQDKADFRVLHLPMDKYGYWRPFSWGYFGSAFFNFMINKPYIDKTFEPASMENAYLHKRINDLQENFQSIENEKDILKKSQSFYELLKKVGVKYLILDETESVEIETRGIIYWGTVKVMNSKAMIKKMEEQNLVKKIKEYPVNINSSSKSVILYELKEPELKISFLENTRSVDPKFNNIVESDIYPLSDRFTQKETEENNDIYPFKRQNSEIQMDKDKITLRFNNKIKPGQYTIERGEGKSHLIDIYVSRDEKNLIINFYLQYLPRIGNNEYKLKLNEFKIPFEKIKTDLTQTQTADTFFSNLALSNKQIIKNLRLKVEDTVITLPTSLSEKEEYAGSTVIHNQNLAVSLLQNYSQKKIDLKDIDLMDNPNCFGDKLDKYNYSVEKIDNIVQINSQNGSTCVNASINKYIDKKTDYLELGLTISGQTKDFDNLQTITSKPLLDQKIRSLTKPNSLLVCLKERLIDGCFNTHEIIHADNEREYIIPAEKQISDKSDLLLLLATKNILYQKQKVNLTDLNLNLFTPIVKSEIKIPNINTVSTLIIDKNTNLEITFPKTLSSISYYHLPKSEGFYVTNGKCSQQNAYRSFRLDKDNLISYSDNCNNQLFADLPFSSDNFYLWLIDYNLASGSYPKFILNDGFYDYINERFSLNQGYPDIKGFKLFQEPEFLTNLQKVSNNFENMVNRSTFIYLRPQPELYDFNNKHFLIEQNTENEGLFSLNNFSVINIPASWNNLVIKPENNEQAYDVPQGFDYKQILPSLWQVKISMKADKNYLLNFNEAYDSQWKLYGIQNEHMKCDGYANCFAINSGSNQDKIMTFYIFYTPERLSFLGWGLTSLTLLIFVFLFVKFRIK